MIRVKRGLQSVLLPLWRFRQRNSITILMLHGVMDEAQADSSWTPLRLQLSPTVLETAMRALGRAYRFISLEQAVAMLRGEERLAPRSLVLTFDDGYRNNLTHAWPVLRKYGAPMTIFLSTGHVARREPFWYDRMDYALQHLPGPCDLRWGATVVRVTPADRRALREAFRALRQAIKEEREPYLATMARVEEFLDDLERRAGRRLLDIAERDPWSALVTWEEVRSAAAAGVKFGSHTVDHVLLDKLEDEAVRSQLTLSADQIEAHTGASCRLLCYPNGSWSQRVAAIARDCGYDAAVTTGEGQNSARTADLLALHRNNLGEGEDDRDLLAAASGLQARLQLVRRFWRC